MANYKNPADRASETVTFRLTLKERQLLMSLADTENKSLTDLMRFLLQKHAEQIGLTDVPVAQIPSRPAAPIRPRPARRPPSEAPKIPTRPTGAPYRPSAGPSVNRYGAEEPPVVITFGDLVVQFRASFSTRAEGTKKELEEMIIFLCDESQGAPLIAFEMPLYDLTSAKLKQVRDNMMQMAIRVAKKNLHLTYLRMMLHWAVKQENIDLKLNPALDLKPFTITEVPGSWLGSFSSSQ